MYWSISHTGTKLYGSKPNSVFIICGICSFRFRGPGYILYMSVDPLLDCGVHRVNCNPMSHVHKTHPSAPFIPPPPAPYVADVIW